jgi:hypothetical protein
MPYGLNWEQWEAVCAADPAVAVIAARERAKRKRLSAASLISLNTAAHPRRR